MASYETFKYLKWKKVLLRECLKNIFGISAFTKQLFMLLRSALCLILNTAAKECDEIFELRLIFKIYVYVRIKYIFNGNKKKNKIMMTLRQIFQIHSNKCYY